MTKKGANNVTATAQVLAPPWRERLPDGTWHEYGPRTLSTYQRHVERFKNWAYRKPSKEALRDADQMIAFVRLEDGSFRDGIPDGELKVYVHVYEKGHAIRHAARELGLSRETVRSYLRRLRARVGS